MDDDVHEGELEINKIQRTDHYVMMEMAAGTTHKKWGGDLNVKVFSTNLARQRGQ